MKIDNSLKSVSTTRINQNEGQTGKASAGAGPSPLRGGDSVSLSDVAAQLQAIEKNLANIGVVDAARVSEIKQAIGEGRFKVNPEAVADKLLESVREFIQARKP